LHGGNTTIAVASMRYNRFYHFVIRKDFLPRNTFHLFVFAIRILSVPLYCMQVSRINSPIGRNATLTCIDNLFDTKLSSHYCFARFISESSAYLRARANALRKAVLARDGTFALSGANHLRVIELNYLIESLTI